MLYGDREQDLAKLTRALILVEDNRNTSASRLGLEKRAANLNQIVEIFLDVLDLSENDLGDLYSDWIEVGDDTDTG